MTESSITVSATPQGGARALSINVVLPVKVDVDGVRAKFSKKRKKLTVRAPVA